VALRRTQLDEDPPILRGRVEAAVSLLTACGYSPQMG